MKLARQKLPCVLENVLIIISNTTGLSFELKRIGLSATIIVVLFYLLVLYLFFISKLQKKSLLVLAVKPCWNPLVNTFCSSLGSTLLLIERTTIDPLYLWVIKTLFWRRCRGVSWYGICLRIGLCVGAADTAGGIYMRDWVQARTLTHDVPRFGALLMR